MPPSAQLEKFLTENGLDPEKRKKDRARAIHQAVLKKRPAMAGELLDLYPEDCLDAKDTEGPKKNRTPIHNATQLGLLSVVEKLIAKGAQVDAQSPLKWTALIFAASYGRRDITHTLLAKGADIHARTAVNERDKGGGGLTALHLAAQHWSGQITLTLLLNGADPKATCANGDTPLHFAVRARSTPCAALLLFHGASLTAKNLEGITCKSLLNDFSQNERKRFEHIFACAKGKGNHIEFLQEYRKRPEIAAHVGEAVHWAIDKNLEMAVSYLIHADPFTLDARSPRGWYPLHRAARRGFKPCVQVLLQHGADVNCLNNDGWTPLMFAAKYDHTEIVQFLLDKQADRDAKNHAGETALQIAQNEGHRNSELRLAVRFVPPSEASTNKINLPAEKNTQEMENLEVRSGMSEESRGGRAQEKETGMLKPPKSPRRTPSPALSEGKNQIQGELFALTDATVGTDSRPAPEKDKYLDDFFLSLEKTWYERIHWTPDDDEIPIDPDSRDWSGPVKIAVLDTGVDLGHEDFTKPARRRSRLGRKVTKQLPEKPQRERIKAVRNFVGKPGEEEDVTDEFGHGTHIAGLIMAVAPRAEIYIAKVSTGTEISETDGSREPRRPVEEAIRWAMSQGVNIINLSLGFPKPASYKLNDALNEAVSKGIVIFAAAANHGDRSAIAWPARNPDLTICVSSSDKNHKLSSFAPNPSPEFPMFVAPGENVWSHWPTNLGGGFRQMSGTSVSTPIAVGMAAIILAFLNKTDEWALEDWEEDSKASWLSRIDEGEIRRTRGMSKLLVHICRDRNNVKILSPHLMWEGIQENTNPRKILTLMSGPFGNKG